MKAAMNEDSSTSETPYSFVVSMRSREKAMPGKTLRRAVSIPIAETSAKGYLPNILLRYAGLKMHGSKTHLAKKMRTIAGITR